jgi:hypothetical protein
MVNSTSTFIIMMQPLDQDQSINSLLDRERLRQSQIRFNVAILCLFFAVGISVAGAVMALLGHTNSGSLVAVQMVPSLMYIRLASEASKQLETHVE